MSVLSWPQYQTLRYGNDELENNILTSVLGNDLLGLLGGLRKANEVASRATHGLTNSLRHAQRNRTFIIYAQQSIDVRARRRDTNS
jgi:hypothetical protein